MHCFKLASPLLLLLLAHCQSAATACPESQVFIDGLCCPEGSANVDGVCRDLCAEIDCDDSNDCTFEECVPDVAMGTASCVRTDAPDGRACADGVASGNCARGACLLANGTGGTSGTGGTGGSGGVVTACDPADCDDGNPCTDDVCNRVLFVCENEISVGRACTRPGALEGVCSAAGACVEPPPLCDPDPCVDTGNDCTEQVCQPTDGSCVVENLRDVTPCNDAPGGVSGFCFGGQCEDPCENVVCSNQDCYTEVCNPDTLLCERTNRPARTPCNDGGGQVCDGSGNCVECTINNDCFDMVDCTYERCDNNTCVQRNANTDECCDDGLGGSVVGCCGPETGVCLAPGAAGGCPDVAPGCTPDN